MVFAKIAVLAVILSVVLAYMLYPSLPDELDDKKVYQTVGFIFGVVDFLSKALVTLFGNRFGYYDLQRYVAWLTIPINVLEDYPDLQVNDFRFEGVSVRVYKPKSLEVASPGVIFIHGGGWSLGSFAAYDATVAPLALNTSMVVVSIDHRLAPENPYPAPFEDCLQVTKHVLTYGQKYGIDVNRVAIAGDSSGGNLATAVAHKLAEEKSDSMPSLKLQLLIYPVTQVVNLRTSSYLLYKNYPLQNQRYMAAYIASYLLQDLRNEVVTAIVENRHISPNIRNSVYKDYFKKENLPTYVRRNPDEEIEELADTNFNEDIAKKMDMLAVDPYVSPLLAQNLSQLPPAYVVVCEFDVLRDDGLLYVHRLRQAGVDVELSFLKNQPHSAMYIVGSSNAQYKETKPEYDKIYRFLKKNL